MVGCRLQQDALKGLHMLTQACLLMLPRPEVVRGLRGVGITKLLIFRVIKLIAARISFSR